MGRRQSRDDPCNEPCHESQSKQFEQRLLLSNSWKFERPLFERSLIAYNVFNASQTKEEEESPSTTSSDESQCEACFQSRNCRKEGLYLPHAEWGRCRRYSYQRMEEGVRCLAETLPFVIYQFQRRTGASECHQYLDRQGRSQHRIRGSDKREYLLLISVG